MTPYLAYFKISFKQNTVYRIEWVLGIVNTCVQIFILIAIWKALYSGQRAMNGIDFSVIATNFIISLGLSNVFYTNDFAIQRKLNDGSIANELLKPIDFRKILLANNLGEIVFKFFSNFIPSLIITSLAIGILPPAGILALFFYAISMVLGFAVLWSISLIVQMTAFWIINVWSVSTIKDVFIRVLSGIALPLWFMPKPLLKIIEYTPFDSIYHIPMQIYLGQLGLAEIGSSMMKQIIWVAVLYGISVFMWHRGKEKIIMQGG